jgi:nucleoside-diphosphate-sugar epimerase
MILLITGATGLVGTRLLPRLIRAGHECRVLVRPGRPAPTGVTPVPGDITDATTLPAAICGVGAIVHLAAHFRTQDPVAMHQVNVAGTRNLVAATCEHAPDAQFVLASTGLVYHGTELRQPAREVDQPTASSPYTDSKIQAERIVTNSPLNWSILRLGFVYGDADGHLQAGPRNYAARGAHPATPIRLVHHRDIATAVELALSGALARRVVNIADDAPISVAELATFLGQPYPTSGDPLRAPWRGHLDTTLARRLGFRATVASLYQAQREGSL